MRAEEDHGRNDIITGLSSYVETELMFEKVVTPSDVGKLNRLVIPKQHAETHFPLRQQQAAGRAAGEGKGVVLSFEEERTGRLWRFRYSYWGSSHSYVLTKGWSRFVREKRLRAGDAVAFARAVGARGRLFIRWATRPGPRAPQTAVLQRASFVPAWECYFRNHPTGGQGGPAKRLRLFGVNLECPNSECADADEPKNVIPLS